jgi:hypothetical protein
MLEKAWAKVKGNYLISEGGMTANGIRALTGVPVFDYIASEFSTNDSDMDDMWDLLVEADANDYILGAGTYGAGDSFSNYCGVAQSHAYSIISVFTMEDSDEEEHRCLLMRNPWGSNGYNWHWSHDDPKWTDDLVAQVPYDFDPVNTSPSSTGLFVMPFEGFQDNSDVGYCFDDL